MKRNIYLSLLILVGFCLIGIFAGASYFFLQSRQLKTPIELPLIQEEEIETREIRPKTRGIMMLIEYKDTRGLVNFVNDLYSRGIDSLLSVSPTFVEEHCETIKELLDYGVEIVSQNPEGAFWDIPYEEQYQSIRDAKEKIEACTGKPLRIVSSRYFASDENTVKAAEQLGIPYVLARGVAGTEAIVFKPEEYNVRIISVSNIPSINWKYGSLCDYSYWVREGHPEDMEQELLAVLENRKVTPVSHTNLGGLKVRWNKMWLKFFDSADIEWQSLDDFATADITLPMWRIPRNKNAPYTPQKRALVPYEEEEDVDNPCSIENLPKAPDEIEKSENAEGKIMMFHNGRGSMCLEAIEFFKNIDYPLEEYLNYEPDFNNQLNKLIVEYKQSEGVSESFGYYPIIFIKGKAYSGFNEEIKSKILEHISNE